MILRKPYAFLIKHFRLLHAIILILLGYILYGTINIFVFLKEAAGSYESLIGKNLVETYITPPLNIFPIICIVLLLILLWVLIIKKKKFFDYIIVIICIIVNYVIYKIAGTTLYNMEVTVLENQRIMFIRDIVSISAILQIYPLIIMLIRTTGFDLKKFDFLTDLQKLDIEDTDREEIEVSLDIDTNILNRKIRYYLRHTKYFYKEHKYVINIAALVVLSISLITPLLFTEKTKIGINYNQSFTMNGFSLKILNSYSSSKGYNGNTLSSQRALIIIPISIRSLSDSIVDLNTSKFELSISNHTFTPTTSYASSLDDLGTMYINQKITQKNTDYLLAFEVPKSYINKKMKLKMIYNITNNGKYKYYNMNISPTNIDDNVVIKNYNLNDELVFNDFILNGTYMKYESLDVEDSFLINYNYCVRTTCYPSVEYISASYKGTGDKTLLKLKYKLELSDNLNSNINTTKSLFEHFVSISYKKDNKEKEIRNLEIVYPKRTSDNEYIYIELPSDIKDAQEITMNFNVRNTIYKYKIRGEV